MKYQQLTRLFVTEHLRNNNIILSNLTDIHYLVKVMRKRIDDTILLFNGEDGEYLAKITEIKPKQINFTLIEQVRSPRAEPQINLIFAPIKQNRMIFLLEKTTELGVSNFTPIKLKHSVVDKINIDKWHIYIKEACEQSRRLSLPTIQPLISLDNFLSTWNEQDMIYLCNEMEESLHLASQIALAKQHASINLMIGPEGGFSSQELELLRAKKFITSVSLGKNILRSETAAIAAVTLSL